MKIRVAITRQENAEYFNKQIGDIVEVEFEEYVAAVVASEIGNAPLEACKAQAVAARSFAMSRSVLYNNPISDSSAVAQAYRAKRYNEKTYPNCIRAAQETAGQALFYNLMPATTIYTASNGGRTVSCYERWHGRDYVYLISQNDPWDAAVGKLLHGTGVGMSQEGAMYAAKHGYNYKQILEFYYPHTKLVENYTDEEGIKMALNEISQITTTLKKSMSGAEVVFLQNILNTLGYDCGTADGNFGRQTEAAVKAFQKDNGLTVDGIVGPKTAAKLMVKYTPPTPNTEPEPTSDPKQTIREELILLQKQVQQLKEKIDSLLK